MRVIATKKGFDNIRLREPGEEFEMPDGSSGSWFEPVRREAAPVKVPSQSSPAPHAGDVKPKPKAKATPKSQAEVTEKDDIC